MNNSIPAILGGLPAVTSSHDEALRWPQIDAGDEAAVLEILRHGNISSHPIIRELEDRYAEFTGMPFALAHANGTSALHAAFFALDLKPGDEVLVPSATFWASVLPIVWAGAIPVFCESEPDRLGIDPVDMEKKITARTRAVVVVHLWGLPAKMTEIYAVAQKHRLKIVEDAAHAHGATWRGRSCGSLGDICVFSLQGDKLAPAGEGGILLCRDEQYFERAVLFGDITRIIELDSPAKRFAATSFGVKTRIAPMSAALGCSQLGKLEERNARRNKNLSYLSIKLEALGIHTFLAPPHIVRTWFEFIIRNNPTGTHLSTSLLVAALQCEGCQVAAPRYPLVHQQPFFTERHFLKIARLPEDIPVPVYDPEDLPDTQAGSVDLIRMPSFPQADRQLLDEYVVAFDKVISHAGQIAASGQAHRIARDSEEKTQLAMASGQGMHGV